MMGSQTLALFIKPNNKLNLNLDNRREITENKGSEFQPNSSLIPDKEEGSF